MARFGELLSELRQDHHMTQKDLAAKLFVSVSTVSNYENDIHYPDVEKLIEIATLFGVTTDYLLGRSQVREVPSILSDEVVPGKTAYVFAKQLLNLPSDKRKLINTILEDEMFCASIRQHL